MSDGLRDPFESQGSQGGPPVISWKKSDPGDNDTFVGILVPADVNAPAKPYRLSHDLDRAKLPSGEDGPLELMYWPPNGYNASRKPVGLARWHEIAASLPGTAGLEPNPVTKTEFFMTTDLPAWAFVSASARKKMTEAGVPDEGDRRVVYGGTDLKPKITAALAKVGGKPEVGQKYTIKILERRANTTGPAGSATSIYRVEIERPSAESMAKVEAYVARIKKTLAESGLTDPWSGSGSGDGATSEEPPF